MTTDIFFFLQKYGIQSKSVLSWEQTQHVYTKRPG